VARHNVERAADGAELDVAYLTRLSDDAVPAIADAVDEVDDPGARASLIAGLSCGADREGAAALNVSVVRAADVRRELRPDGDEAVRTFACRWP